MRVDEERARTVAQRLLPCGDHTQDGDWMWNHEKQQCSGRENGRRCEVKVCRECAGGVQEHPYAPVKDPGVPIAMFCVRCQVEGRGTHP